MSNVDSGYSNIGGSLWFSENSDKCNILMRTCAWSSSVGGSVMTIIDSGDGQTGWYVTRITGLLSVDDEVLFSLNQVHYYSVVEA